MHNIHPSFKFFSCIQRVHSGNFKMISSPLFACSIIEILHVQMSPIYNLLAISIYLCLSIRIQKETLAIPPYVSSSAVHRLIPSLLYPYSFPVFLLFPLPDFFRFLYSSASALFIRLLPVSLPALFCFFICLLPFIPASSTPLSIRLLLLSGLIRLSLSAPAF